MRKAILMLAALGAMVFASSAFGESVTISDPSADAGVFSGTYETGQADDPATAEDESTGTQQGYVYADTDGNVIACNGNQEIPGPTGPLQGYIWVGDNAAYDPTGQTPGGEAGAGANHQEADGTPTGNSPCPESDPEGVNE